MAKLPRAREVQAVLKKLGFYFVRQSGSHAIYKNDSGKKVVLPVHGGKTITPGVFSSILGDLNIDKKNFWKMI